MTRANLLRSATLTGALVLAAFGLAAASRSTAAEEVRAVPAPASDEASTRPSETAIVAGGCFWGVQGVFQHVKGVTAAVSGYAGGTRDTANYDAVSTGETGHAESVRITFDPRQVSYGRLLQIFFSAAHDPTQRDRQGPDRGTQYRSAIFPTSAAQAKVARDYVAQLDAAHVYEAPLATAIEADRGFTPAEPHHQDFLARNPTYPYIAVNDLPKVAALQRLYPALYRATPVLVAGAAATD